MQNSFAWRNQGNRSEEIRHEEPTKAQTDRTGREWAEHFGTTIIEPDGWRCDEATLDTEIEKEDFVARWKLSTGSGGNQELLDLAGRQQPVALPKPEPIKPKDPTAMTSTELAAYMEQLETKHRKTMNLLRAMQRVKADQESQ